METLVDNAPHLLPRTASRRGRFGAPSKKRWWLPPRLGWPARYLVALAGVALPFLVQHLALPRPHFAPFAAFPAGLAIVAWLAGLGPALVAVVLSAVVSDYFFLPPYDAWELSPEALQALAMWLASGTAVAVACTAFRRALLDLSSATAELARQSELLDLSDDAVIVWTDRGGIERWNRGAERLYGYRAEEAAGRTTHQLLATSFPQPWREIMATVRAQGSWSGELRHRTRDGRDLVVLARLQRFRAGPGDERVLEVNRDITESKRAERELRASETLLRQLAEALPQGVWIADGQGGIEFWNRGLLDYAGVTLAQARAEGDAIWKRLLHDEDRPETRRRWDACLLSGEPFEAECRLRRADGMYRWFLARGLSLRDDEGRVARWVGTHTDIDDLKRAQAEVAATRDRLAEADRRKDEFLAMLSHELRNPLAPIRNGVYLLAGHHPTDEATRRTLSVISRQVDHLTRLVEDLLDVSRISRGKVRIDRRPLDLAEVVRHAGGDLRSLFDRVGVRLVVRVPAAPLPFFGDGARLTQAIGNLLHNAARFTPAGGVVTLSLGAEIIDKVGLTAERAQVTVDKERYARIEVIDTGPGVDPAMRGHLFEPFAQGTSGLDRPHAGLGLGLALVKGLVELHGGTVFVEDRSGGPGAVFVIRLPLAAGATMPASPATTVAGAPPAPSGHALDVLIIEDNEDAADTLGAALELFGHRVRVAYDGPSGIEAARRAPPDVVLCDVGLPGMSGYDVARTLRADPRLRAAHLVALTGYASSDEQRQSQQAGFERHLAKPIDPDDLDHVLTELTAH